MVRYYTDGSYSREHDAGAFAVVMCETDRVKEFFGVRMHTTNNGIELRAVNEAVALSILKMQRDVEIFTDSAYVLNNIKLRKYVEWQQNDWKATSGNLIKNAKEWQEFAQNIEMANRYKVKITFTKVKAHNENSLNDKADYIAKNVLRDYISKIESR